MNLSARVQLAMTGVYGCNPAGQISAANGGNPRSGSTLPTATSYKGLLGVDFTQVTESGVCVLRLSEIPDAQFAAGVAASETEAVRG